MSKKIQEKAKTNSKETPSSKIDMVFEKQNYMLTGLAFAVVVLGFLLMWGGKEDIYSFRRITLAPIVVIAGFLIGVFAIMYKPKNTNGAD
jgi:amino acid permease